MSTTALHYAVATLQAMAELDRHPLTGSTDPAELVVLCRTMARVALEITNRLAGDHAQADCGGRFAEPDL